MWIDEIIRNIERLGTKIAIKLGERRILYRELYQPKLDSSEEAIKLIVADKFHFVPLIISTWLKGRIAVPVDVNLPSPSIEYRQSAISRFSDCLDPTNRQDALILFTSGTTGNPKGVIHTYGSLDAQITGLRDVWKWKEEDNLLLSVPLTHIHGLVTGILSALSVGATVELVDRFDPKIVWEKLLSESFGNGIFTAVPTIYAKLLEFYDEEGLSSNNHQARLKESFRLMISGSAPLSKRIFDRWKKLTGHGLLERYGTTETGIVLSAHPDLISEETFGSVGSPLPGVKARIENDGELAISGATLFRRYLEETSALGTGDRWYNTGDIVRQSEHGYHIVGRTKEIIKVGGYRVAAAEVEKTIMESEVRDEFREVAVVGVSDDIYGEMIVAFYVSREKNTISKNPSSFIERAKKVLAAYQLPRKWIEVEELPRNQMGKIDRGALVDLNP